MNTTAARHPSAGRETGAQRPDVVPSFGLFRKTRVSVCRTARDDKRVAYPVTRGKDGPPSHISISRPFCGRSRGMPLPSRYLWSSRQISRFPKIARQRERPAAIWSSCRCWSRAGTGPRQPVDEAFCALLSRPLRRGALPPRRRRPKTAEVRVRYPTGRNCRIPRSARRRERHATRPA